MNATRTATRFGPVQIGIVLLAIATAAIHLFLATRFGNTLFYLNGFGYLALVAALYLPQLRQFQPLVRWVLIGYTVLTIVLWFFMSPNLSNPIGIADKLIEVALVALLFVEMRQTQAR